ncbi:hypothetical protein ISF6_1116 [Piscinibacter sakaiensis]|uniref:Uncharacterized protein n=1 Tax=Piscinibacter sakaiensis TaxID=1547922 RepID=A0A0K8NTW5_PISS1|nr:hypothetical protein ISF6_1116 [Piscinibacter sakaiensis]
MFAGRWSVPLLGASLLAACASPPPTLPGPLVYSRSPQAEGGALIEGGRGSPTPTSTVVTALPTVPLVDGKAQPDPARAAAAAATPGGDEPVSMALDSTPLPLFIQILYGNVLKRPHSMDPAVLARTDLVNFRTSQPIPKAQLAQVAVTLLRSYGLAVQELEGVVRIVPDNSPAAAPPPVLRRGRALPETPEALRPAFQYVEMDVVKSTDVLQWLRQIMGNRVNVQDDSTRNGFLLAGTQADLRTALELIRVLDQPRLRGSVARRITPVNMPVNEFSARLNDVLTAQGYSVSTGASGNTAVLIVPVPTVGSVMVFTTTDAVMEHVIRWSTELDRPVAVKAQSGLYTYPVKYADAQELAKILGEILTGIAAPSSTPATGAQPAVGAGAAPTQPTRSSSGSRVVVNQATNTLIFRGTSADEYQQIMSLMRDLDRPVKSAMIEVTVAELSRNGSQALGIDWNVPLRSINSGELQITGGTLNGVGVASGGFSTLIANSANQILARLNASVVTGNARILSNPKVLARNGETASIQVGEEVPVITSQQSTGSTSLFGGTGVLQQIAYRSTGVILRVRPIINSGNRLDLDISQEVSAARQTATGVSGSPTVSTRRIDTKLSLRDGSTILLGGLISRQRSGGDNGVPLLKDIPGIGAAFRSTTQSDVETEMLIMITPYVINDDYEAESISEALQQSFGDWAQDLRRSRAVPERPTAPAGGPLIEAPGLPSTPPVAPLPGGGQPTPAGAPPVAPAASTPATPAAPSGTLPGSQSTPAASPAAPGSTTAPGMPPGVIYTPGPGAAPAAPARPASAPAPAPAASAAPLPPSVPPGSREVTDPKVKEEIQQLLEKKK